MGTCLKIRPWRFDVMKFVLWGRIVWDLCIFAAQQFRSRNSSLDLTCHTLGWANVSSLQCSIYDDDDE